jgi:hypothetical protein
VTGVATKFDSSPVPLVAAALVALDRDVIDADVIEETLGLLLKNQEDIDSVRGERIQTLLARAMDLAVR